MSVDEQNPAAPSASLGVQAIAVGSADSPVCEVLEPARQTIPAVFASPHSGDRYPDEFIAASRLDPQMLRRSEDSFVDRIYGAAPELGAPLLRAFFPRAYIDPNREPFELDPEMFEDELPSYVNAASPRVAGGLGTIARVVANGEEIYKRKLRFAEAAERINALYRPYHRTLQGLIERTREQFGYCLLVDCHSMPSIGGPMDRDAGLKRVDMVLGDCFGASCAPEVTQTVEGALTDLGYRVTRNMPYSGGFTTLHYGQPAARVHALQIEINRELYMDELRYAAKPKLASLTAHMGEVIALLKTRLPDLIGRARP